MLLAVFAPLLVVCQVSASTLCASSMPSNVEAGVLQPDVIELLQRSVTFRRQCARIAATRVLRVSVHIGGVADRSARAQTTINRYEAGGMRAEVTLRFSEDYLESWRTSSSTFSSRWTASSCATKWRRAAPGRRRAALSRPGGRRTPGSRCGRNTRRSPLTRTPARSQPGGTTSTEVLRGVAGHLVEPPNPGQHRRGSTAPNTGRCRRPFSRVRRW